MSDLANLELCRFDPGAVLFEEGDETFFFYMIKEGKVEVYKNSKDGQEIPLAVLEPGQSLGEFAMIDRKARSASARALDVVTAVRISEAGYQELLDDLPSWARSMLEGLVVRLRKANDIIEMHESIEEKTRTDVAAAEFSTATDIKFDFDFSDVTVDENYEAED